MPPPWRLTLAVFCILASSSTSCELLGKAMGSALYWLFVIFPMTQSEFSLKVGGVKHEDYLSIGDWRSGYMNLPSWDMKPPRHYKASSGKPVKTDRSWRVR